MGNCVMTLSEWLWKHEPPQASTSAGKPFSLHEENKDGGFTFYHNAMQAK